MPLNILLKLTLLTTLLMACNPEPPKQNNDAKNLAVQQHQLDTQMEVLYQTQEVIKYVEEQEKLLDEGL